MKCIVERIESLFEDDMYFFEFELPEEWEEFLSDFKEIIGHQRNTKYIYFSDSPKKGWYLCKSRAEKARLWALANFDEIVWCGETLKTRNWRQDSYTHSLNISSPEMDFLQACLGNGRVPKEVKIKIIKSIYKSVALIIHPDKGGDTEHMQKINSAYEQLIKSIGG